MKKEKMNDKGFSLVELIIVIAIMAVLVVVLAPQYLKYVERSRNSTDVSNATSIVTACQVYAADPDATAAFTTGNEFDIKVTATTGEVVAGGTGAAAATDALKEAAITISDVKCKSKSKWTWYNIHGKVETNGSITFTYTCDKADAFKDAMTGKTTTESGS